MECLFTKKQDLMEMLNVVVLVFAFTSNITIATASALGRKEPSDSEPILYRSIHSEVLTRGCIAPGAWIWTFNVTIQMPKTVMLTPKAHTYDIAIHKT